MKRCATGLAMVLLVCAAVRGQNTANDFGPLNDPANPYWVRASTAKLVTPQWIGEPGVAAVIVLAVDDMADAAKYEEFLRPIMQRLKQIDGRSPVSIMTTNIDPQLPQLQTWLADGVSIEAHTQTHPCPCLQGGNVADAKSTFDRCVDQLSTIPNHRPVAYRMPCCDSMNSVSPRFFTEIFTRKTPAGNFLGMDSSVMMLFTAGDPDLPKELALSAGGSERFRKYIPTDRLMVNFVESYPYPYVIDRLCWEFPALMPSDWDAQQLNGKCSPATVLDYKVAIDLTVRKQGVFSICFHPHGWIQSAQIVDLINYAVAKHGSKVKFMAFKDVQQRLNSNLLNNQPLRAADGADNGVRICDVNRDGYMDVVIGNSSLRCTKIWSNASQAWTSTDFPTLLVNRNSDGSTADAGVQWGVLESDGHASILVRTDQAEGLWHFGDQGWNRHDQGLHGLPPELSTSKSGADRGVRLRDLDHDGRCELVVGNAEQNKVYRWGNQSWEPASWALPEGMSIADAAGRDAGLRFIDLDDDGDLDVVFSNATRCAAYRFDSPQSGWSGKLFDAPRRGEKSELPMIVRADGTNNGAWFSYGYMWIQNEDTGKVEKDHVLQRSLSKDLLGGSR